jgi:catalase
LSCLIGDASVHTLASNGHTMEFVAAFVANQYRHGKTILALGVSRRLLETAGMSGASSGGMRDEGVLLTDADDPDIADAFIAAVGKRRRRERERDPLLV